MLKLPHIEHYIDADTPDFKAVIYADDAIYWRFYAIPEIPTIRRDANNNPVFLLTKYRFSDDDLNENPALPRGGGYLLFDVELGMTAAQRQRLMDHLNERVKEIWRRHQQRLGRPADALGGEFTGPQAELAMPEWTGGKTKFYVVDDPNLVKGRIADEAPSLIGSNTAIFNATLTPAGATYMQKTLTEPSGEGGTDLANVQVQYEVKFWGRLPPASISARADFDKSYHAVSSVWHDYEGRGCNEDISKTYEHYWEYMQETDAVSMKIDTGTYELDDDAVKELRMFVMQQLTKWIEEAMLEKLEPGETGFPDMADIYKSSDDIYRLKAQSQLVRKDFRMNVQLTSITEKTLYPQATLATFFKDRSAEEMRQFVRELDLNDPLFKDVQINVRAFADWSMETIAFVKVDVEYANDVRSFNFTTGDQDSKQFTWGLKNDNREYRYRYTVGYKGAGDRPAFESEWKTEKTTQLNIPVAETGRIDVELTAGNIDWKDVVDQVQIRLRYSDSANDVPEESFTAILTQDAPSAKWTRDIFAPRERPVKYIQTFFLKDEQQIVLTEAETTGNRIVVNEPLVSTLNTSIITAGDWDQTQKVIVNLKYEDHANDYKKENTFIFEAPEDFFQWKVLLRDPGQDRFKYRYTVIPKNPDHPVIDEDWREKESGETTLIDWPSPPKLKVTVRGTRLRLSDDGVQEVEVSLRTDHAIDDDESTFSFVFDSGNAREEKPQWLAQIDGDGPDAKQYHWEVIYFLEDREITKRGTDDGNIFWVPQPSAQELSE